MAVCNRCGDFGGKYEARGGIFCYNCIDIVKFSDPNQSPNDGPDPRYSPNELTRETYFRMTHAPNAKYLRGHNQ